MILLNGVVKWLSGITLVARDKATWRLNYMAKFNLKKWFKKWFWPTVKVVLPIAFVAGGIVFVVLAIINQLIDAEAARYLLSAIVQSLAALLAIIFAGVAILWGMEERELRFLESHRRNFEGILFGIQDWKKDDPEKWPLTKVYEELFQMWEKGQTSEYFKSKAFNIGCTNIVMLLRMRSSQFPDDARKKPYWNKLEKTFEHLKIPYHLIRKRKIILKLRKSVVKFFEILIPVSDLYEAPWGNKNDNFETLFGPAREIINLHVKDSLRTIHRARDARGCVFKALISLYSITIAGGMALLSLLKGDNVIPDLTASWIAAGPLLFGIGAVALTFVYLARIVSGEKE
jgi:hypothetical protein